MGGRGHGVGGAEAATELWVPQGPCRSFWGLLPMQESVAVQAHGRPHCYALLLLLPLVSLYPSVEPSSIGSGRGTAHTVIPRGHQSPKETREARDMADSASAGDAVNNDCS